MAYPREEADSRLVKVRRWSVWVEHYPGKALRHGLIVAGHPSPRQSKEAPIVALNYSERLNLIIGRLKSLGDNSGLNGLIHNPHGQA
jgi:hypothetical protein